MDVCRWWFEKKKKSEIGEGWGEKKYLRSYEISFKWNCDKSIETDVAICKQ